MLDLVTDVLGGAEQVYVAIRTRSGPHVTPELSPSAAAGSCASPRAATLKAKVDPASPATAVRSPLLAATSPAGVARFVRDNASELAGAAVDLFTGRLGGPSRLTG